MVYRGSKITFKKAKQLGSGGNGDVYKIKTEDINFEAVVKLLRFRRSNHLNRFEKTKYERFKHEINTLEELNKEMDGLLPLIDYYTPDNPNYYNRPWYVVPYAKTFKAVVLGNDINMEEKIEYIREIAVILRNLHKRGYAHRDIKLDNVFVYEQNIKLGDFGLVWHESLDGLTRTNEGIGAWTTIAPEMKRNASEIMLPFPADVYSFAKLIWIVLTEDELCFDGQYEKDKPFTLDCNNLGVNTIEDIHELLNRATNDDFSKRPKINECIEIIDKWFDTNNDPKKFKRQIIDAKNNEIRIKYEPSITIYNKFEVIFNILKEINKLFYIESLQISGFYLEECKMANILNCIEISNGRETYIIKPVELIAERIKDTKNQCKYILGIEDINDEEIENMSDDEEYININDRGPSYLMTNENINNKQKILLNKEDKMMILEREI